MEIKQLISVLGFTPKANAQNIFIKQYANNYAIELDFAKEQINYGNKIIVSNKSISNFSRPENFVVLECVNRLLKTGYKAENIILEETWPLGHTEKGRLDILVTKIDTETKKETAYLMIECKTFGTEYEKALDKMQGNGGQLFSYFQQDKSTELLMLYSSRIHNGEIVYQNDIIKIEEDYRTASNVKDLFLIWDKLTKQNGVWNNPPYNFQPKALTINDLVSIKQENSSFIFNRFLEILRHNVVSDKPNAFNKIFNLFLCKIYDEKMREGTNEELHFQWKEGMDGEDYIDFQIRLTDLYKNGMSLFLEKEVTDVTDDQFEIAFEKMIPADILHSLSTEAKETFKKQIIYKLRLEKNNEFAIKEVFDERSSRENAKVVKEIVELLQGYKLRYTQKQQYLSDFFELLLTTGLKQEAGQFFTPVPIAQFIIKSLPLDKIITEKLQEQKMKDYLPYIIDYAAGSGHFLTESMHEVQKYINQIDLEKSSLNAVTKKFIKTAQENHFDWAYEYVYGIEKDYRLVKVGKVGCYLHGDGLANVIHSDGLANFSHQDYKGKLSQTDLYDTKENRQFEIVVSNPPYSVEAFKNVSADYYTKADFDIFKYLTDQSSEIEALFVERTKQLLKTGGFAGIVLPSSILSNTGIYTKAREIILKYFDIVAITELGSNTFMATGTNTVILFLRRRDNEIAKHLKSAIKKMHTDFQDVTLGGIENPLAKYIAHNWDGLSMSDYISLLQKTPSNNAQKQELFQEYRKKLFFLPKKDTAEMREKAERDFWKKLLKTEQEKLLYFLLTYKQKVVLVKSGQKDEEKRFLGYEFSNRRGSEGIHPIQKGKKPDGTLLTISDCTKLFDEESFTNPEKASSYVYHAFLGEFPEVHEGLKNHISHARLVDMLNFDRANFEKLVSTNVKKKITFESKWDLVKLEKIITTLESGKRPKGGVNQYEEGIPSLGGEHIDLNGKVSQKNVKFVPVEYFTNAKQGIIQNLDVLICKDGALTGKVALFSQQDFNYPKAMINEHVFLLRANSLDTQKYLFHVLFAEKGQFLLKENITGTAQGGLNRANLLNIKLPLPPLDIQQKIVSEIEILEQQEEKAKNEVEKLKKEIGEVIENIQDKRVSLSEIANIQKGTSITKQKIQDGDIPVIAGGKNPAYFHNIANRDGNVITVSASGANSGFLNYFTIPIFASDCNTIISKNEAIISTKMIFQFLKTKQDEIYKLQRGQAQPHVYAKDLEEIKIPLSPLEIQQKIVSEIEVLEARISKLESELEEIPKKKEEVLKAYL